MTVRGQAPVVSLPILVVFAGNSPLTVAPAVCDTIISASGSGAQGSAGSRVHVAEHTCRRTCAGFAHTPSMKATAFALQPPTTSP